MFYVPQKKKTHFQQEYSENFVKLFNKAVQKSYLTELKDNNKKSQQTQNKTELRQVSYSLSPKKLIYQRRKLINCVMKEVDFKKADFSTNFLYKKCKTDSSDHQINRKKNIYIKIDSKRQAKQRLYQNQSKRQKKKNSLPPLSMERKSITKNHIMQTLKYWNDLQSRYFSKQKVAVPLAINKNPISQRTQKNKQFYLSEIRRSRNMQVSLNEMKKYQQKPQQGDKIRKKKINYLGIKSSAARHISSESIQKKDSIDQYFQPWNNQTKQQDQGKLFI